MENVEATQGVAKAMADKNWDLAVESRGKSFQRNLATYKMLAKHKLLDSSPKKGSKNMGVVHVGAPSCGMNAAVR